MRLKSQILATCMQSSKVQSLQDLGVLLLYKYMVIKNSVWGILERLKSCLRSYIAQTIELTTFCPKPQACGA